MKKYTILINREAGSGGKEVAEKIGALLGINVYSKAAIDGLINHFGLSQDEIEHIRSRKQSWWDDVCRFHKQFIAAAPTDINHEVTPLELYHTEAKLLKELAAHESCVIVGRAAFHIFNDDPNTLKVFFTANREKRIARLVAKQNISDKEAAKLIDEVDKQRETFTKSFAGVSRYDVRNYDLTCNLSTVDHDAVAQSIADFVTKKFEA